MDICLQGLKESNKSRFNSYSFKNKCIEHIPYYLSGLSRAQFLQQPSWNSCIWWWVDLLVEISLVARWFGGKMTVTFCPSPFMVISPPNHLANNKIATKKSTCHLWITLKQLTQFNTQYWLPTSYFFLKLIQIIFEVDPNTNLLLILIKYWRSLCPTTDALTALFISTWILKFKSQLMFAFFAAVNPLSRPVTKQKFTPMVSNERSWLVICEWQILISFVCFPVSRFVTCDHNNYYDWRQLKMRLWYLLLNFRVRVFLKSAVIL